MGGVCVCVCVVRGRGAYEDSAYEETYEAECLIFVLLCFFFFFFFFFFCFRKVTLRFLLDSFSFLLLEY